MKNSKRVSLFAVVGVSLICLVLTGCPATDNANNTTATTTVTPPPAGSPAPQNLTVVDRPQRIRDMQTQRGEQEQAEPALRITEPREGASINGSTVNVRLDLSGNLRGYQPMRDPATGMGNHIHVILDNQPYEAYYSLGQPFELRNVSAGRHTLRVFASRPWHESYKNNGSFQMVTFTVSGGGDASRPTTTNSGQVMADNRNAANANNPNSNRAATNANTNRAATNTNANRTAANANANRATTNSNAATSASPAATPEGVNVQPGEGGQVDRARPLLTYSRPKGEYRGAEAEAIMIDFWLTNATLVGNGGEYRVRYTVDGGEPQYIDRWEPIWLSGWTDGRHTIKLELVDRSGSVVDNGGYNSTTREFTVAR